MGTSNDDDNNNNNNDDHEGARRVNELVEMTEKIQVRDLSLFPCAQIGTSPASSTSPPFSPRL